MDNKNTRTYYRISMSPKPHHEIYFTDETGYNSSKQLIEKEIDFSQLPTPLLKQIK